MSKTPNAKLQAAMDEIENGGGLRFHTPEELFAYLSQVNDEAECEIIVASGILPELIEEALKAAPSLDWRVELSEGFE